MAVEAGEPDPERKHGGYRPDDPLPANGRSQPLYLQPVGLSRANLSIGFAKLFPILPTVLQAERIPRQHAFRRILRGKGPELVTLLFIRRQRDDDRSGFYRK